LAEKFDLDLLDSSFDGDSGTVFMSWSYLPIAIHSLQLLKEQWVSMDMFVFDDYNIKFSKALQNSLHKTEKLFVVVDQRPWGLYENLIKSKLFDLWLIDTEVYFIYPQYEKLTTVLDDYKLEQVWFDGIWIAEQIVASQ
jgi:hypothetical protein